MKALNSNPNIDNSDLANYPDGRIKDNDGTGNGTGVNRAVYGDLHSNISKLMRLYAIAPNGLPDNETNDYQIIEALRALASKNDFIYPLSTNGTILNVDIKFSQMLENEFIVCRAAFDKAAETQIKGTGAGTFTIAYSGDFKTNEYVRIIKTGSGVSIIRLADALSLESMVADLNFLKKATQAEENAGAIDTKATTPLSNKTVFARRVTGFDSATYLATTANHGLYPKTHFDIVAALGDPIERNYGTVSGLDVGAVSIGTTYAVTGDITLAITNATVGSGMTVRCTLANAMTTVNYEVNISLQSQGNVGVDNNIRPVVWKIIDLTHFEFTMTEFSGGAQSLKAHISVKQR